MVCGAAVPEVAVPPGRLAFGYALFGCRSGGRRGHVGDRALDEYWFSRDVAGPPAGSYRACFADASGVRGHLSLSGTRNEVGCSSGRAVGHAGGVSDRAVVVWGR